MFVNTTETLLLLLLLSEEKAYWIRTSHSANGQKYFCHLPFSSEASTLSLKNYSMEPQRTAKDMGC